MEKLRSLLALAKSRLPSMASLRARLPEVPEPVK